MPVGDGVGESVTVGVTVNVAVAVGVGVAAVAVGVGVGLSVAVGVGVIVCTPTHRAFPSWSIPFDTCGGTHVANGTASEISARFVPDQIANRPLVPLPNVELLDFTKFDHTPPPLDTQNC